MKVLSLCDGMSCGHIALDRAGVEVEQYFAAEIKKIGIKVTKANYPDTIHIGDVNKISYKDGVLYTENGNYKVGHIDLVMFGSPCQTFSIAMPTEQRTGLANLEKSGLFFECNRILGEVKPTYFFMENVASMKNSDIKTINEFLGVEPIKINSKIVSPALRNRLYWTNIPNVTQPIPKNIDLSDILNNGYSDRKKARNLLVSDSRPLTTPVKMFHRYYSTGFTTLIFKNKEHYKNCVSEYERLSGGKRKLTAKDLDNYKGNVFDGVRYLDQQELERCQTVPEGYTKCLTRNEAADVLGDGWTVDVIAHIFTNLKNERQEKEMELKVSEVQFPEKISFNFEEIKKEVAEKVQHYTSLVYSDEQIRDAKADRAKLNKFVQALEAKRKEVKKQCLAPYEDFEKQVKEIVAIVNEPIQLIDNRLKTFEDERKVQKRLEIDCVFFASNPFEWLKIEQIFNDKWLNATAKITAIEAEIKERLEQIEKDLHTLSELPEFAFEATEVYKDTLDINKAITEGHRLLNIAKAKAEVIGSTQKMIEEMQLKNKAEWVAFEALLTVDDAQALADFFRARNIEFKPI